MQFGPTSTAPAARTRSTTARSRLPPSAELSPSPAAIATIARAPAASEPSTVSSKALAGTASTTSSGGSGSCSREQYVGCPSTSSPVRLTRKTERRCAPSSAPRAIHCPHFDGSLDAPTTATERGSNSGRRSRLLAAGIASHLCTACVTRRRGRISRGLGAPGDAAGEEGDDPDQRGDHGEDEQPLDHDDRQDDPEDDECRQQKQDKQHARGVPRACRPLTHGTEPARAPGRGERPL